MTTAQVLAYVTTMLDNLGLMPFVSAAIIISLALFVIGWFFSRGKD